MIEFHVICPVTGPMLAAQRNIRPARHRPGANKGGRREPSLLLDIPLSSNSALANSTRHSVTSRIQRNSRLLCYLTFSTRHLNATLEKCNLVEKFNTYLHLTFAYLRSWNFDLETRVLNRSKNPTSPNVCPKSVTQVIGTKCYPCLHAGPKKVGVSDGD